jgi:hypothetical protein
MVMQRPGVLLNRAIKAPIIEKNFNYIGTDREPFYCERVVKYGVEKDRMDNCSNRG